MFENLCKYIQKSHVLPNQLCDSYNKKILYPVINNLNLSKNLKHTQLGPLNSYSIFSWKPLYSIRASLKTHN